MRAVFVHCGLPKTGTTSLQKHLSGIRAHLRMSGFDYPDFGVNARGTAHHNFAREILGDSRFSPARGSINDLLKYLESPGRSESVILSSEGLTHCLFRARPQLFAFLKAVIDRSDRTQIIFTFRKFDRIVESTYLHQLRSGEIKGSGALSTRLRATPAWLQKLAAGLAEMRAIVGDQQFVACDVEECGGDSVTAFMKLLGSRVKCPAQPAIRIHGRIGAKKAALLAKLHFRPDGSPSDAISSRQLTNARKSILAMPEFANEICDYRLISQHDANAIQLVAREKLPPFVIRNIGMALELNTKPYQELALRDVQLDVEELEAVRAVLPRQISARLPWLRAT